MRFGSKSSERDLSRDTLILLPVMRELQNLSIGFNQLKYNSLLVLLHQFAT